MLGYLSLDIICSSKLTVFLELRSRKTVRLSEQIMSADKYPSIFSRQMEAIVYVSLTRTDVKFENLVETTFLACEMFTSGFRSWLINIACLSSPFFRDGTPPERK